MGNGGPKRLVALASRQFGVVTAEDCAACRVSLKWLRRRIETGEWTRLHPGVFRLGSNSPSLDELEMAAMLAAGGAIVFVAIARYCAPFKLAEAAEAHRLQEANSLQKAGTLSGKIVLTPG